MGKLGINPLSRYNRRIGDRANVSSPRVTLSTISRWGCESCVCMCMYMRREERFLSARILIKSNSGKATVHGSSTRSKYRVVRDVGSEIYITTRGETQWPADHVNRHESDVYSFAVVRRLSGGSFLLAICPR